MVAALALMLMMRFEAPPPRGTEHYFAKTTYAGPGLVCGSAFSFDLRKGETAVLNKPSAWDGVLTVHAEGGTFFVHESQEESEGGKVVARNADGQVALKQTAGHYAWIYTNDQPGSTNVSGPAVDAARPTPTFQRIAFGTVRYRKFNGVACMDGLDSERR